jgi:hypothetical protein
MFKPLAQAPAPIPAPVLKALFSRLARKLA